LEKFELISNKIVNLLARPPAAASLLQRGAPTRRASEKVGSNRTKINSDFCPKKNAKILKNFYKLKWHACCNQLR
jgi:hypothetical protein